MRKAAKGCCIGMVLGILQYRSTMTLLFLVVMKNTTPCVVQSFDVHSHTLTPHFDSSQPGSYVQVGKHSDVSGRGGPLNMVANPSDDVRMQKRHRLARSVWMNHVVEIGTFVIFLFVSTFGVISWEDVVCSNVLPSRHRTTLQVDGGWGASTIHGMGFGSKERHMLFSDPMASLPSYNEIMLEHREITLPQWKTVPTPSNTKWAIHTVVASLETVWELQIVADDYQWDVLQEKLHAAPFTDLPAAAALLRQQPYTNSATSADVADVVGFDWGSCAWRHCGAVADIQEAFDELDQLLGVLEPFEAVFCLDIVERSLRDILDVIPWDVASTADVSFRKELPLYVPKQSPDDTDDGEGKLDRIDDAYLKALQELRID